MAGRTVSSTLKRTVDVVVSCASIAVLAPLLAAIAIAIVVDSRGGVLFRSIRIGRGRHPFAMLKFRRWCQTRIAAGRRSPPGTISA